MEQEMEQQIMFALFGNKHLFPLLVQTSPTKSRIKAQLASDNLRSPDNDFHYTKKYFSWSTTDIGRELAYWRSNFKSEVVGHKNFSNSKLNLMTNSQMQN